MAPNHQVTLGHELPEASASAAAESPQTDEPTKLAEQTALVEAAANGDPSCSRDSKHLEQPYLPLKWHNIISIGIFHAIGVYGFYVSIVDAMWSTILWSYVLGQMSGIGVTGGVHRLWTHRSYKAKVPMRVILSIFFSIAGQNTIFEWVRDHRVHHKYSETDADPHNANNGFFFAHVGWLMKRKHPEVIDKGNKVDMSDILNDPVVQWHNRYFIPLKVFFCFLMPPMVAHYCWGETWRVSILVALFVRYMFGLNFTWLVNSAAHIWGNRPYEKQIFPAQNKWVAIVALGEGWHNYHHVFPWDYKTAELGSYGYNWTTAFIDMCHRLGWAYDLKVATNEMIQRRALRTGDGSHHKWGTVGGVPIVAGDEEDDTHCGKIE